MNYTIHDYGRDLLYRRQLSEDDVRELLVQLGFADWRAADCFLRHLSAQSHNGAGRGKTIPLLLAALSATANPEQTLSNFKRFVQVAALDADLLPRLQNTPRLIEILITLFGGSHFLTEILLRHPDYSLKLTGHGDLAQLKGVEQLNAELKEIRRSSGGEEMNALRKFQRLELLRIGACDLLGLFDIPTVTAQLSHLADSLVAASLDIAALQSGISKQGFAVLALGKLGGGELNYSSDIDLLFLAETNADDYRRLGERLIECLSRVTPEGFLYRVDMRLRPWGQSGALVNSIEGYTHYLGRYARLWEKQALLKARVIAGDRAVGDEFLQRAEPLIFESRPERVRADIHSMKQRTENHLLRNGRRWGEVKLGEGSIRDVEFVVQYLQLVHGAAFPDVRSANTIDALGRLFARGILTAEEYRVCLDGYVFLRTIEHYLQMLNYRQTHTLPGDIEGLTHLARRLGFAGPKARERFVTHYQQHSAAIRSVYRHYLESDDMDSSVKHHPSAEGETNPSETGDFRHSERMDPSYLEVFTSQEIARHAELASWLDDENQVEVEAERLDGGRWCVTIIAYDYLGELSLICGLLFAYGFNIVDGKIFTYEPLPDMEEGHTHPLHRRPKGRHRSAPTSSSDDQRQKIVDVFTVESVLGEATPETWLRYKEDLTALLRRLQRGEQREAQGELAQRVASTLHDINGSRRTLYPVEVSIDNDASDQYTVLRIDTPDTIGFLYELTNALALNGVYIARMTVGSAGNRVRDTLWVTDARGNKITSPERQRELRAATVLVKHFTHLLPQSPNPEAALLHFDEFLDHLFKNPNWPDELASLERPEVLQALARLLGVSEFLWDDFLRMQYNNLFPVVRDVEALTERRSKKQLQAELAAELATATDAESRRAVINAFKDREMFRVDMRHIQGHVTKFGQFSAELTDLAEVVVEAVYQLCEEELRAEFGAPCQADGQPCRLTVCGLGKCGARELGFASDIELMFIYEGKGQTSGPTVITTAEFYEKLVQEFIRAVRAQREGIFEIDLQLRPYGKTGSMAVSLDGFRRYFAPDGPAWAYERQALIKLRPIAGDRELGQHIVTLRDAYVYSGRPFDVTAMRAMRERQIRHLVSGGTINAKYSPGGLVDLEYLVQGLQINHGHRDPGLRQENTRQAMIALANTGIIAPDDFEKLRDAHRFLRRLIDALRMVRGNARDLTVPNPDSEEFAFLARRQGYGRDVARLQQDLNRHMTTVQELSRQLLG